MTVACLVVLALVASAAVFRAWAIGGPADRSDGCLVLVAVAALSAWRILG